MNEYIRFTREVVGLKEPQPVYVNVSQLVYFTPMRDGRTLLHVNLPESSHGHVTIVVHESLEQVAELLSASAWSAVR